MNRQDAIRLLQSDVAAERLRAARELYGVATAEDVPELRERLAQEGDTWVQRALERAIDRRTHGDGSRSGSREWISLPEERALEELRAEAIEIVTKLALHEVRKLVGSAEVRASAEIKNYATSRTYEALEKMKALLGAVERLNDAAASPRWSEVDLTDLVTLVIRDLPESQVEVLVARTDPVTVRADPDLLRLALDNIVRNGVEACQTLDDTVTVNWGVTDREHWITVLDEGRGLPPSFDAAAQPGTTTKAGEGHLGWGLTIT